MSKCNFDKNKASVKEILLLNKMDERDAEIVADCLVTADEYGVTSHGTSVLPAHIERIKRGGYKLDPQIKVVKETAAFAVIDGDNALGPVSAMFCVDYAIEKCKQSGVFTVLARNNNTFGPAFYYSLKAAERGYIAFVCSNSPAQMAPIGGTDKLLGTNPFATVFPVPGGDPIIVDMATSVVAKSKFKEYKLAGLPLPEGWALDSNGSPTTDPDEAMKGMVLPMSGFKGYGMSMMIDIYAGLLSGAAYLGDVGRFYSEKEDCMNVGFYMTVIDPKAVLGEEYDREIKKYVDTVRNSTPAKNQSVALPGDDRMKYKKERN